MCLCKWVCVWSRSAGCVCDPAPENPLHLLYTPQPSRPHWPRRHLSLILTSRNSFPSVSLGQTFPSESLCPVIVSLWPQAFPECCTARVWRNWPQCGKKAQHVMNHSEWIEPKGRPSADQCCLITPKESKCNQKRPSGGRKHLPNKNTPQRGAGLRSVRRWRLQLNKRWQGDPWRPCPGKMWLLP